MTDDASTKVPAAQGLDDARKEALAGDLKFLAPEDRARLLSIADGLDVPPNERFRLVSTALDLLRLADPALRPLLLALLADTVSISPAAAREYLHGAVNFICQKRSPDLIEAWAKAGGRLAGLDPEGGREFFLKGAQGLLRTDDGLAVRIVRLFRHLPLERSGLAFADLARLAEGAARVGRGDRTLLTVGLLERVMPVSWQAGLFILDRLDELLRHLGWEKIEAWTGEGLRLAAGSGKSGRSRARLYFSLASSESREALDRIGSGQSLTGIRRYLAFYAALHAGRAVDVAALGSWPGPAPLFPGLAFTDGCAIFLPERLPFLDDRAEGRRLYLVLTAREAARIGGRSFEPDWSALAAELEAAGFHPPVFEDMPALERFFKSFPHGKSARDLYDFFETFRVEAALAREYPGLAEDLDRFRRFFEPGPPGDDRPAAIVLHLAAGLAHGRALPADTPKPLRGPAESLAGQALQALDRPEATVESAARLTVRNYLSLNEIFMGGFEVRFTKLGAKASPSWDEEGGPGMGVMHAREPEAGYSLLARCGGRETEPAGLTDLLAKARTGEDIGESPEGACFTYDEWDADLGGYRLGWVKVRETAPPANGGDFVERTRARYDRLARRVRRQFELLRPEGLSRRRGVTDGDEPDLDRIVEAVTARRAGGGPPEGLYIEKRRSVRDVAAAILVDVSGSTARPAADGKRVIDLEKESLVLLAEALETVGDAWAMFGFSGAGRENVRFYTVKGFGGRFDGPARRRLGALEPDRQNRDGAALRHAGRRLAEHRRRRNLLILLTDGEPDDYEYQGRYAREDTRAALRDLRRMGIHTFCVAVGEIDPDRLDRLFAGVDHAVVGGLEALPEKLGAIYRRLTS